VDDVPQLLLTLSLVVLDGGLQLLVPVLDVLERLHRLTEPCLHLSCQTLKLQTQTSISHQPFSRHLPAHTLQSVDLITVINYISHTIQYSNIHWTLLQSSTSLHLLHHTLQPLDVITSSTQVFILPSLPYTAVTFTGHHCYQQPKYKFISCTIMLKDLHYYQYHQPESSSPTPYTTTTFTGTHNDHQLKPSSPSSYPAASSLQSSTKVFISRTIHYSHLVTIICLVHKEYMKLCYESPDTLSIMFIHAYPLSHKCTNLAGKHISINLFMTTNIRLM